MDFAKLEQILSELNRKRRIRLFLFVLFVILSSLFGAGGFALIVTSAIAFEGLALGLGLAGGFLSFLVLTLVFLLLCFRQMPRYEKDYCQSLVPLLFPDDDRFQIRMMSRKEYEPIVLKVEKMLRRSFDIDRSSYFRGMVDGIDFCTFSYDNYQTERRARKEIRFTGRYVFFRKTGNKEILVKEKGKASLFRKVTLPHKIRSESIVFDEGYEVFAYDEKERLPVEVLDCILSLNREMEGRLCIKSDESGVSFFYDRYRSSFRFGLTRKATLEQVQAFRQELLLPLRLSALLPYFAK